MAATVGTNLPIHLDFPCDDGAMVHNFQELPQSILLSDTLSPRLRQLHPTTL